MEIKSFGQDDLLCARCSLESGSCCKTAPKDAKYCFPISRAEIEKIIPHAHLSSKTPVLIEPLAGEMAGMELVCAVEENQPEFIEAMISLFPNDRKKVLAIFPSDAKHFRLRLEKDGSCTFLGKDGCRLPRDVRPWYCLLFPAWFQGEYITLFNSKDCLAVKEAKSPAEALERIGMSMDDGIYYFQNILHDWGLKP